MSIDELLRPRYKVIADYPESRFTVGDILHRYDFKTSANGTYTYVTNLDSPLQGSNIKKEYAETLPHLFKKLEWWEERKPEDLPKHVRYDNKVSRIVDIEYDDNNRMYQIEWDGQGLFHLDNQYQLKGFSFWEVEPATAEEYTQYITTKNA